MKFKAQTKLHPNHRIDVSLDTEGNVVAQIEGIQGQGCEGILDVLAEAGMITDREHTDDHDKPEPQYRGTPTRTHQKTGH
jgi:hypothetical protein